MNRYTHIYSLLLLVIIFCDFCSEKSKTEHIKDSNKYVNESISHGPKGIVRNIIQDRKGNIWIAAFAGIFRYDGNTFTNITEKVSSSHFFSILEDRKGNLWFGSIGSGVYCYNGRSFKNFTTKNGLAGNGITCIYEDRKGNIWFGTETGASCYDGKSFKNFTTKEGLLSNDINSITEDNTGKIWFGTTGNACFYDGKKITALIHYGKPFTNVRSMIEDKKGNIWLGGNDGLWCYNGKTFRKFTDNFVGCIYEDKKGNIWTGSQQSSQNTWNDRGNAGNSFGEISQVNMILSRYDEKSLSNQKPTVTEIKPNSGMICGILEAKDGSIWFCTSDGVDRYNGNFITTFSN